jgi:23S rRNA-/tRNA-specific pseudouridylate synthase
LKLLVKLAAKSNNVPRKEKLFYEVLKRAFKVKDETIAQEAWKYVSIVDEQLNHVQLNRAKKNISATEIMRETHKKVWNVHRLDCETSGVLAMAITEDASADICTQFREGRTAKRYIAVVSGHVDPALERVSVPLGADYEDRPLQV